MPVSHQTIKLSAGRHRGPEDGACAMELASMFAGEPFGDHPRSVCPVIAGFLRSYNDHVDERRRQDLYVYASQAVGTRADGATERQRAELCRRWVRDHFDPPPLPVRLLHRLFRCQGLDVEGVYAARAAVATSPREVAHRHALQLVNELIACGADAQEDEPERVTIAIAATPATSSATTASPSHIGTAESRLIIERPPARIKRLAPWKHAPRTSLGNHQPTAHASAGVSRENSRPAPGLRPRS